MFSIPITEFSLIFNSEELFNDNYTLFELGINHKSSMLIKRIPLIEMPFVNPTQVNQHDFGIIEALKHCKRRTIHKEFKGNNIFSALGTKNVYIYIYIYHRGRRI